MLTVDQVRNLFANVPKDKWHAAVQSLLAEAAKDMAVLHAKMENMRRVVKDGVNTLLQEARSLREGGFVPADGQGGGEEAVGEAPPQAPPAQDRPLTPAEIEAQAAAIEAGGPEAVAAAAAALAEKMAASAPPPRAPGQPKAGPPRSQPPQNGNTRGQQVKSRPRPAGPPIHPGQTRMGQDGTPLTPDEEADERDMDAAIAEAAAKQGQAG